MGGLDGYKPEMAMVGLQFIYAGVNLFSRAAFLQGMRPRIFVVYRQAIATLIMAPIVYLSIRKDPNRSHPGLRSLLLMFLASIIGITANQNTYFDGLYLASSTMASTMTNLIPAITFVIAFLSGLEKVNIQSLKSIAKIAGTVLCISGAISMVLLKGPNLLDTEFIPPKSMNFSSGDGNTWLLGCLLLFGSTCFWSLWMILQVPISESCPNHLLSSTLICFFATLESATIALVLEQATEAWTLHSFLEWGCCLFSGIGWALTVLVQVWCISKRGPVFCAMFNPLCTVIVTILAGLFLHEDMYIGSLIGACAVIIGLYIVLWGKAKDPEESRQELTDSMQQNDQITIVQVLIEEPLKKKSCKYDLEETLLSDKSTM